MAFRAFDTSFEDALDQVARLVPGIVWLLQEQPDSRTGWTKCVLNYYDPVGKVFSGWDLQ